jgi:hypothetical protein
MPKRTICKDQKRPTNKFKCGWDLAQRFIVEWEGGELMVASLGSSWLRSKERSPCPHSACSTQSSGTLVRLKLSATRASSTAPPMALVTTWLTGGGAGAASPFSASSRPNTATVSFHSVWSAARPSKVPSARKRSPRKSVSKQISQRAKSPWGIAFHHYTFSGVPEVFKKCVMIGYWFPIFRPQSGLWKGGQNWFRGNNNILAKMVLNIWLFQIFVAVSALCFVLFLIVIFWNIKRLGRFFYIHIV